MAGASRSGWKLADTGLPAVKHSLRLNGRGFPFGMETEVADPSNLVGLLG